MQRVIKHASISTGSDAYTCGGQKKGWAFYDTVNKVIPCYRTRMRISQGERDPYSRERERERSSFVCVCHGSWRERVTFDTSPDCRERGCRKKTRRWRTGLSDPSRLYAHEIPVFSIYSDAAAAESFFFFAFGRGVFFFGWLLIGGSAGFQRRTIKLQECVSRVGGDE